MNIYEGIEKRRSIRRYKSESVPESVLQKVLNAARLAPSGCNRQAWKLIVVRDREAKSKIAEASCGRFPGPDGRWAVNRIVADAPIVIVACGLVRDANMRYLGVENEEPIMFSNRSRKAGTSDYWGEYVRHASDHTGEYESMGIWDLAIALDHLTLAALEEGLGTCWIGAADERAIREILSVPDEVQARMIMLLGYPDESPESSSRKRFDEVVCYDTYS